jgi:hypothetical protein
MLCFVALCSSSVFLRLYAWDTGAFQLHEAAFESFVAACTQFCGGRRGASDRLSLGRDRFAGVFAPAVPVFGRIEESGLPADQCCVRQ